MALTTTTTRTDTVGDGSTRPFPFTWRCDSAAWVHVYLDLVEQFSGFTVALNANQDSSPGGSVTFAVAPALGVAVRVARIVPLTQETVLTPYSPFPAKTLERSLDRAAMHAQGLAGDVATVVAGLAAETASRIAGDSAESSARTSGDAQLSSLLSTETGLRAAGDAANAQLVADLAALGTPAASNGDAVAVTATGDTTPRTLATWMAAQQAEALKLARTRQGTEQLEVPGTDLARAMTLRAVLSYRRLHQGTTEVIDTQYGGGSFINENEWSMETFPEFWTAARIRQYLALCYSKRRSAPYWDLATAMYETTDWYTTNGRNFIFSSMHFGNMLAMCIERGDTTAWSDYGTWALDAMNNMPRSGTGCLTVPDLGQSSGIAFPYHDTQVHIGDNAIATAYAAWVYQRLARVVDPTLQARADALISGLRSLRRSDGYYNAATNESVGDVFATALAAGMGLCNGAEAEVSGRRLADDYLAGLITEFGFLRELPKPYYWTQQQVGHEHAQDFLQNGGCFGGPWVSWAAKAMVHGGRADVATKMLSEAVDSIIRVHNHAGEGNAPTEYFSENYGTAGVTGYTRNWQAGCFLQSCCEPVKPDIVFDVPGAASSVVVVPYERHDVKSIEAIAAAGASPTATVEIKSARRYITNVFDSAYRSGGYGTELDFFKAPLDSTFVATPYKAFGPGICPVNPSGGYFKARVLNGSSTQPITIRMRQGARHKKPRLVNSMASWSDDFATDQLRTQYVRRDPAQFLISAGRVQCTGLINKDVLLAPTMLSDGDVQATVRSAAVGSSRVGLCIRWKGPANYIYARTNTGQCNVVHYKDGVISLLGTLAFSPSNNTDHTMKLSVRGDQVTLTVDGNVSSAFTTTVTGWGLAGLHYEAPTTGNLGDMVWDDLVVTPVPTSQRDWISDGASLYTQTGTWSVASTRLICTTASSPVAALHPDFSSYYSTGVTATFKSANWAARPAGLVVRANATGIANCIYAVCNGTQVNVYDRASSVDTLVGTCTLDTPVSNGVDLVMSLRTIDYRIHVKVGSRVWTFPTERAQFTGTAGAFATGATSDEVSYGSLRIEPYDTNRWLPIPPGHVLEAGAQVKGVSGGTWATASQTALLTHDPYAGVLAEQLILRGPQGEIVATLANADDAVVIY